MEHQILTSPFLNIPRRKLDDALEDIKNFYSTENGILTKEGAILTEAFFGYYNSNIPVDYWWRDMSDFIGPQSLKKFYESYVCDIKAAYKEGKRARFGGKHGIGKMQDLETVLPTPDLGFIELKYLKEGDKLFDENGNVCTITKLHPIDMTPESYTVTFDDGEQVKVCKDHLWLTWTLSDRNKKPQPSVKSTQEIFETQYIDDEINHSVPVAKPLQYPGKDLPIDPYTVGCFIGNGTVCIDLDSELLNTLFSGNKDIPDIYLFGSIDQRLALAQGLLDICGSCSDSGLISFYHNNSDITNSFYELITSLGVKCIIKDGKVLFRTTLPVFRTWKNIRNQTFEELSYKDSHRYIVSVTPTNPVPMRCITVDSPSHLYLVTRSCIPTHNTMTCACILKRVVEIKQYSALYVNLTDVIHVLLTSSAEDKVWARKTLLETDFLVIDELDDRFMGSENAADLFGRILEPIMRTRIQNRMPLFFCTNTSKVEESFSGPLKASIESLMNLVKLVPIVGGDDARTKIKRGEL